jgi:hypothetical protein
VETVSVQLVDDSIDGRFKKVRVTIVDITGQLCSSWEMPVSVFLRKATHCSIFAPPDVMNSVEVVFDDD